MGLYYEAIHALNKFIVLDPSNAESHSNPGVIYALKSLTYFKSGLDSVNFRTYFICKCKN